MRREWWKSRKVWGTIVAAFIRLFGVRLGLDPDASADAALLIFGGVSVEGIIDAAAAFAREWRSEPGAASVVAGTASALLPQILQGLGKPPTGSDTPTEE